MLGISTNLQSSIFNSGLSGLGFRTASRFEVGGGKGKRISRLEGGMEDEGQRSENRR